MCVKCIVFNRYIEFCNVLCEIHLTRGHLECSLVFINQVAKLLECEEYCKCVISSIEVQVKSMPTCADGAENQQSGDASVECSSSFSEDSDDSFLSEMAASVKTPPLRRTGTKDHLLSTHPPLCTCLMCVSHVSLLQSVKLALLVCDLAMQRTLEFQAENIIPELNGCAETLLKVLSDANALLNNRIPKCNKVMESIVLSGGNNIHIVSHSKSKPKSQRSNRAGKSTKKTSRKSQDPLSSLLDITRSSSYFCVYADQAKLTADCYLLLLQPDEAITCVESAIERETIPHMDVFSNEKLAHLHYTLGVARVQELENNHPELAKSLWEGGSSSEEKTVGQTIDQENDPLRANLKVSQSKDSEEDPLVTRRPRRGRKAVSKSRTECTTQKPPSSKHLSQVQLSKAATKVVEHFLTAYQLCFPTMPAFLLRDTSRWLTLLLSGNSPDVASHFLALSMNVTLTHQTIYSLGKKIK